MEDECFDLSGKSDFTLYCYNIAPFHKSTRRDSERRDAVFLPERGSPSLCRGTDLKDLLPHRELLPGKAEEEGPQTRAARNTGERTSCGEGRVDSGRI